MADTYQAGAADKKRTAWRHKDIPGWENESKCPGYYHADIWGYQTAVRCTRSHAHRLVECFPPSGARPTAHEVTERGIADGDLCPGGMAARLGTEDEARHRHRPRPKSEEKEPTGQRAAITALTDFRARECRDPCGLVQLGHIIPGLAPAIAELGGPLETPPAAPDCSRQAAAHFPPIPEQGGEENAAEGNLVRVAAGSETEDDIPF